MRDGLTLAHLRFANRANNTTNAVDEGWRKVGPCATDAMGFESHAIQQAPRHRASRKVCKLVEGAVGTQVAESPLQN
jgi:hypothetical protein